MTNSFLPNNSFQPQASPVDTYVRPSQVAPTTGFDQLVNALVTVNPSLNALVDSKIKKEIKKDQAKGTNIAVNEILNEGDVAKLSNKIRKKDGDDTARQLIGGSIFADKAYQRTRAKLEGLKLKNLLESEYSTAKIDTGAVDINQQPIYKNLNEYGLDSSEFTDWRQSKINASLAKLGDLDPDVVNEHFMPTMQSQIFEITNHHIQENKKYKFNLLQSQIPDAVTLASQSFAKGDNEAGTKVLADFVEDIYKAGVTGEDAKKTYKLLIKSAFAKARLLAIDEDKPKSMEIAEDLPEKILGSIPWGDKDLTDHPDYLEEAASFHEQFDQRVLNKLQNKPKIDREIKKRKVKEAWSNLNNMTISEGETPEAFNERKKATFASLLNNPEYADKELQAYVQSLGKSDNYELITNVIPGIERKILSGVFDGYDEVLEQEIAVAENKHVTMDDEAVQAFSELRTLAKTAKSIGGAVDKSLDNIMKQVDKNLGTGGGLFSKATTVDFKESTRIRHKVQTQVTKWYKDFVKQNGRLPSPLQKQQIETQYLWQVLGSEKVGGWKQEDVDKKYPPAVVDTEGNITSGTYENPFYEPPKTLDPTGKEGGGEDTNKDSEFVTPGMNFNQSSNQTQDQPESEGLIAQLTDLIERLTPGGSSPVAAGDLEGKPTIHRVQSGDYLEKIADRYGLSSTDLIDANDLENPDVLQIGQELLIPEISKQKVVQEIKPKNLLSTPELTTLRKAIAPNIKDNSPIPRNYLIDLYRNAGFEGEDLKIMVAIALAESRGRPNAINKGTKDKPEESYGISQINMYDYPDLPLGSDRRPKLEIDKNEALYDPVLNALAARLVFNEFKAMYGDGFLAWSVYSSDGETKDENPLYVNFLE